MNKLLIGAATGALALAATSVFAQEMTLAGAQALLTEVSGSSECSEPAAPAGFPDGATSTEDEMMAAIGNFKTYAADSENFRMCLDAAAQNMGEGLTEQHNQAVTLVFNANANKVEALSAEMNEQIRAFNEANPG